MARLFDTWRRLVRLYQKEIWQPAYLRDNTPRGWLYAGLRLISITWTVFNETRAASRAAALSYSSLLGLGPLVAIVMLVAGFVLNSQDPQVLVQSIEKILSYVAPQLSQYQSAQGTAAESTNHELVSLIHGFITGSRSGTAGTVGVVSLIFIVLMLFTNVENAFNEIWGVRQGRSWLTRIVFYWTIVTLGAVLFFTAFTALGAGAFINVFVGRLPFGSGLVSALPWALPLLSITTLLSVLTIFYRFVPNTHVFWRSAIAGAAVVTALVFLNNLLAFFYLRGVLQTKSLYGSVGIVPILMLGLYGFWLFVLIGGQVSYATQNVHFRNSQAAWGHLAESMRERVSLAVLLCVCRRFEDCQPPYSAPQMGDRLRVPTQIINECLNRLVDMRLISPVPPADGTGNDYRYQPARPLSRITLQEFKALDDNYGDDPVGCTLAGTDPLLARYDDELSASTRAPFFVTPLDQLIEKHPFPPAATPAAPSGKA